MKKSIKKIKKSGKNLEVGVLLEDFNSKFDLVIEQTSGVKDKLDSLEVKVDGLETKVDNLEVKVDNLTGDIDIVKTNLEFVKNSLKIKVDAEEFATLEHRVTLLESRLR